MADEDKKEEIKEEEKEEVKEETIRDVVEEAHAETDETQTEEASEEPVEKETEEEAPPKEEEKDTGVDAQEVADAAKEKGKEEVKQEILKALGVTQEEKTEAEEAGYQTPWEKRGEARPKDWQEAVEAGADLADFRRQEAEKKVQEEQKAEQLQAEQTREQLNKYWDRQLDELRNAERIPQIDEKIKAKLASGEPLTKEEMKDPGIVAQQELFETMHKVGSDRQQKGQDVIYNLKEIYYEFYDKKKPESKQPAGADAPISGGQKTPISQPSEDIDYSEIHKTDMEEIIRNG